MELTMRKTTLALILAMLMGSSLYARGTSQAIVISPYFNFGYVSPGDINDKITMDPGGIQSFVPDAGTIRWAKDFGVFMGYRFKHRFNIGLIIDRTSYGRMITRDDPAGFAIWHPNSTTQISGVKYYEFSTGGSAISFGPAFYYNVFSGGRLSFDAGLGILYAKGNYHQDATYGSSPDDPNVSGSHLNQISGSGSGFGFMLDTTTTYYLTNYMGLSFKLGYRYLKFNTLTDANGDVMKFMFNNGTFDSPNMTMDFSGVYFGLGLQIDFNINSGKPTSEAAPITEEQNTWNDKAAGTELNNAGWETPPLPVEEGPSIDDIRGIKKQVQRKYNEAKTSGAPDAQAKTERYQKLYDITNRLERDWDQFSPKSRKDKIEKIKLILSR